MKRLTHFSGVAIAAILFVGCDGPSGKPDTAKPSGGADHGHDHGHDHAHDHGHGHDHGPHEGHLVEVGEEQFHLEWIHDDQTGKVTIHVLDGAAKKDVPIGASELVIDTKVGTKELSYTLPAVNPTGDPPKSAQFEVVDKTLIETLKLAGHGVTAKTKLEIDGKSFEVEFKH